MTPQLGTIFGNAGQPGAEIHLCPGNTADVQATTWADLAGDFVFGNVQPGNYTVRQVVPAGYVQKTPVTPAGQPTYGNHVTVTAGQKTKDVNFVNVPAVAAPPPVVVQPPAQPTGTPATTQWGINSGGANDAAYDPTKHLELAAQDAACGFIAGRYFGTQIVNGQAWHPDQHQNSQHAGYKFCIYVFNPQTQSGYLMPKLADQTAWLNSVPPPSVTGYTHFEWGNEVGSKDYYRGSEADYAASLAAAYPILKAKGYKVILSQDFFLNTIEARAKLCGNNYDAIGVHAYYGTAAEAIAAHKAAKAFADSIGKDYMPSEVQLHFGAVPPTPEEVTAWEAATTALVKGLNAIGGTYFYYGRFQNNNYHAGPAGLMDPKTYKATGFEAAFKAAAI